MKDEKKTKRQLLQQILVMRQRIDELENSQAHQNRPDERHQSLVQKQKTITYTLDDKRDISISQGVIKKWQNIVDILAKVINVPAALIMKVDPPYIEVFRSSKTNGNPYKVGDREHLTGLYCETVIKTRAKLLIPNALRHKRWRNNPDIKLGMISYLGFPLLWPDGEFFGTICVLDSKENPYSRTYEQLLFQFRELVESHLNLLFQNKKLQRIITERKQAEEEIGKVQERFSGIYNSSKDAIGFSTLDGRLLDVNEAFCRLTRYSREEWLSGKRYQEITPEEYHEYEAKIIQRIIRTGKPEEYEKEYIRKDGSRVPILLTTFVVQGAEGKPIGIAAIIKDITERKEMQEKLVCQERLAVLGELAGGVSHELRNPLGAIKNAAYFLRMALEEPEPEVKETLEILQKEVATSESIIDGLLDFARPKPPALRKVDVNNLVQETVARIALPENIQVVSQPEEKLPTILADPEQLIQVFTNIILNAIQAMPEGGKLTIKSKTPSKGWVAVSFADTGEGISGENLQKLFEPLFTTKAKGIGLGLAVTRALVERHRGFIDVESEVRKGSTFTVRVPTSAGKGKDNGGEGPHPDSG